MDSEKFFLKWNNYESNLASGFADLLQKEAMVDVTLAAEGKIVQAHKIILSVCSSYFRNMFQVNPCQHPIVILKDVRYQELADMLDFMYKGEANVRQEDLPSFLKLAETLKVKGLAGSQGELSGNSRKRNFESQNSNYTKESSSFSKEEPSNDFIIRDTMVRKKAKRGTSPLTYAESKDLPHSPDIKLDMDRCDNNFMGNIVDNSCQSIVIKEERLSDNSLDSYGENHMPESSEVEKNARPSTVEENCELVPQGSRRTKDYCFTESCFGGHLLTLNGHMYRRKSVLSTRSYWTCCRSKCSAKGVLLPNGEFQLTCLRHSHKPDFGFLKRKEKLTELKKLALELDLPGHKLLETLKIKDDIKRHLNLVRTWRMRNKKRRENQPTVESLVSVGGNYSLIPTQTRSKEILLHLGYHFRKDSVNRKNPKCKYWRCKVKKCRARLKTDEAGNLIILNAVHNHPVKENNETTVELDQILNDHISSAPEEVINENGRKEENSRKVSWRGKKESEMAKLEKQKVGPESVSIIEETSSAFCPSENFSFDRLMAETLEENYCVSHGFSESLNLLKNE